MSWYRTKIAGWPSPRPEALHTLRQIVDTDPKPERKQLAQQALETIGRYARTLMSNAKDHKTLMALQGAINAIEQQLNIPPENRAILNTQMRQDIMSEQEQKQQEAIRYEQERRRNGCNIKVLELDQFTASADNIGWHSLREFDPDALFGGDADAARQMFGGHYQIKWVCENESPSIGSVWMKDGEDGKLKIWKANYDSSD